MKKGFVVTSIVIALVAFLAGYLVSRGGSTSSTGGRKVLYYVDPMHPAYKSDKPGIAPDCGMQLEPVYADGGGPDKGSAVLPPGAVQIPPERQQLIGISSAVVEKVAVNHTVRVLGRVTPDENRIFRVIASIQGFVKEVSPVTTGSFVKEDQFLASIYSVELWSLINSYIFSLNAIDRQNKLSPSDIAKLQQNASIRNSRNSLINIGMSETQLEEILTTRSNRETIDIRAVNSGYVLQRNITLGERFERGAEFYRIADLSKVWVMADVFENEAFYFKPGVKCLVRLPHQNLTFTGRVSTVLPLFDPVTRTLKVRLEVDNTGMVLRPDMFVDVELPVNLPPTITVSREALLDSGLKKVVFIDQGKGIFEPRTVETGRNLGDRVEIVTGLMPGEKVVVSGNFLLDSESRLKNAAAGIFGKPGKDPVCGMALDEDRAKAAGLTRQYGGKTWYFCSPEDMAKFDKAPQRYSGPKAVVEPMTMEHGASGGKMAPHSPSAPGYRAVEGMTTHSTGVSSSMPMPSGSKDHAETKTMPKESNPGAMRRGVPSVQSDVDGQEHEPMAEVSFDADPPAVGGIQIKQVPNLNSLKPSPAKVAPATPPSAKPVTPDSTKVAPPHDK